MYKYEYRFQCISMYTINISETPYDLEYVKISPWYAMLLYKVYKDIDIELVMPWNKTKIEYYFKNPKIIIYN